MPDRRESPLLAEAGARLAAEGVDGGPEQSTDAIVCQHPEAKYFNT
jgi:cobalamin-dependent methionine synthase I